MKKSASISKTNGSPVNRSPMKTCRTELQVNLKSSNSTKPATSERSQQPPVTKFESKRSTQQVVKPIRPKSTQKKSLSKIKSGLRINSTLSRGIFQSPRATTGATFQSPKATSLGKFQSPKASTAGKLQTRANCAKTEQPGNKIGATFPRVNQKQKKLEDYMKPLNKAVRNRDLQVEVDKIQIQMQMQFQEQLDTLKKEYQKKMENQKSHMWQDYTALADQKAQLQFEIHKIQNSSQPLNNDQSFGDYDLKLNEDTNQDLRRDLIESKDAQNSMIYKIQELTGQLDYERNMVSTLETVIYKLNEKLFTLETDYHEARDSNSELLDQFKTLQEQLLNQTYPLFSSPISEEVDGFAFSQEKTHRASYSMRTGNTDFEPSSVTPDNEETARSKNMGTQTLEEAIMKIDIPTQTDQDIFSVSQSELRSKSKSLPGTSSNMIQRQNMIKLSKTNEKPKAKSKTRMTGRGPRTPMIQSFNTYCNNKSLTTRTSPQMHNKM